MQKHKLFTLALLCGTAFAMNAAELPESVQKNNLFQEFRLGQGMIYEVYVKSGDGVTTVTFPSAISKIAGVNVSTDGSSDFVIAAKPGSYYFNIMARKKGATGTLTVIHNRQTYILYLKQDDKKAYASVNFASSSGGSSSYSGKSVSVTPARLLSLIDMTKGYELFKKRYPSEVRDTVHVKNHRFFNYGKFKIELLEVVRFNREDTLVFKLLMHNESAEEISYDKFSFSAQVGGKTYYMSSADASGVMPPKSATWAFFTITGTPDGGRNNLAPDNEFMVGVTAKYMEEEFCIIESQPEKVQPEKEQEKTADPMTEYLNELADRLEKKLAELEKTEKTVEEIKKNEVEAVPENTAEKVQEIPATTQDVLAPPAVDAVVPQPEKVTATPEKTEPPAVEEQTPVVEVTSEKQTAEKPLNIEQKTTTEPVETPTATEQTSAVETVVPQPKEEVSAEVEQTPAVEAIPEKLVETPVTETPPAEVVMEQPKQEDTPAETPSVTGEVTVKDSMESPAAENVPDATKMEAR